MTTDHLLTCVSLVITGFFVYGTFRIDAKLGRIEEHLATLRKIAHDNFEADKQPGTHR